MPNEQMLNRALGAYLGFACGDALGATVEFMTPKQIQKRYGVHQDVIGGGWLGLEAGQVTDDTQMALALGQAKPLSIIRVGILRLSPIILSHGWKVIRRI